MLTMLATRTLYRLDHSYFTHCILIYIQAENLTLVMSGESAGYVFFYKQETDLGLDGAARRRPHDTPAKR